MLTGLIHLQFQFQLHFFQLFAVSTFFIFVEIVDTSWRVGSVGILYLDLDTVQNVKKS